MSMTHPGQYLIRTARSWNTHTTLRQATLVTTATPGAQQRTHTGSCQQEPLSVAITERWFRHSTVSPTPPLQKSIYLNHLYHSCRSLLQILWIPPRLQKPSGKSDVIPYTIVSHSMLSVLSNSSLNKIKPKGFKTTSDRLLWSLICFIGSK